MKPVNKYQFLDSLESKVERHLQTAVQKFQNVNEQVLNKPADNDGWSIAQCLEHLNSYGHYYLPHFKNGMEMQKGHLVTDSFESTWLGNYFTRMMAPETGKKKHKAFKGHIPVRNLDGQAVVAEFINQQETLLQILALARKADLNAIRIPISISRLVRLKLGDALQFLIAHNDRHLLQASRNLPINQVISYNQP